MTPYTDLRIGDAERDATIELLGRHFVDGRLTRLEHEERTEAALRSRTRSDLDALLADLPDLHAHDRAPVRPVAHRPGPWRIPLPLVLLALLLVGVAAHGGPVLPLVVLVLVAARLAGHRHAGHGGPARGPGHGPHRR